MTASENADMKFAISAPALREFSTDHELRSTHSDATPKVELRRQTAASTNDFRIRSTELTDWTEFAAAVSARLSPQLTGYAATYCSNNAADIRQVARILHLLALRHNLCSINLTDAVTLLGAYDRGGASPAGLQSHVICCNGR